MTDDELTAEIERRRRAREEVEDGDHGKRRPPPPPPRSAPPRRTAAGDDAIRKAYAALEVSPGSDFETVRQSYRRMMRKYHPDLHGRHRARQAARGDRSDTQRLSRGLQDARARTSRK